MWLVLVILIHTIFNCCSGEKNNELSRNCGRFLSQKYFHGNNTDVGDFPWLVLLEYETTSSKEIFCGGVLISHRHVLTTARCAKANWTLASVRLGEHDMNTTLRCNLSNHSNYVIPYCLSAGRSVKVDKTIVHDKFELVNDPSHNIALLRLAEEVIFDSYVQPICLPEKDAPIAQKFHVAGWATLTSETKSFVKLRSVVSLTNKTKCRENYGKEKVLLADDEICVGGNSREYPCFADSGGPLMGIETDMRYPWHRMTVFGLLAGDSRYCNQFQWPAVFVDVTKYRDWILKHLQNG